MNIATYTCEKCGMSVNSQCAKCDTPLKNKTITIDNGDKIDLVVAIGPPIMMKMVAKVSEPYKIPTLASLNTIMVDGTGMCGGCRVTIDGKVQFVCVDGPEFDAHKTDFDEMMMRLSMYKGQEKEALDKYEYNCNLEGGK